MSEHLIDGEFQSDKYPTTPRGKVPLSCKDKTAQDLLWQYAQRRRSVDAAFSADLEEALKIAGYTPQEPAAAERRCIVDDGQMCPNTCAREGQCVWSPREPAAEAALSLRRSADSLKSMLEAAYQRGRLAGREEAAQLCEMTAAQIRLMCGELTAGEMRSVRAMLTSRAAAIWSRSLPQEGG